MPDFDFNAKDGKWFYMSHEFTDALIQQDLSGTEFRLLLCLVRWAWSWKHSWVIMRWGKIKKRTGMSGGTAWKAFIRLKARNMVNSFPQETEKGLKYKINSKFKTWKPVEPYKPVSHRKPKVFPTGNQSVSHRKVTPLKEHIKETSKEPPLPPALIPPKNIIPTGMEMRVKISWIDPSAWDDFVLHRKNIKHELTPLAITKAVNFLSNYQDFQQIIVDNTIVNNWRGLFAPPGGSKATAKKPLTKKQEKWKHRYESK